MNRLEQNCPECRKAIALGEASTSEVLAQLLAEPLIVLGVRPIQVHIPCCLHPSHFGVFQEAQFHSVEAELHRIIRSN